MDGGSRAQWLQSSPAKITLFKIAFDWFLRLLAFKGIVFRFNKSFWQLLISFASLISPLASPQVMFNANLLIKNHRCRAAKLWVKCMFNLKRKHHRWIWLSLLVSRVMDSDQNFFNSFKFDAKLTWAFTTDSLWNPGASYRCEVISKNVIIKKTDGATRKPKGLQMNCTILSFVISTKSFSFQEALRLFERKREFIADQRVTGLH